MNERISQMYEKIRTVCDYASGLGDDPPRDKLPRLTSSLWGVWWATLLILSLIFCGQGSKFIYIDF